jgi:hypothetical protein
LRSAGSRGGGGVSDGGAGVSDGEDGGAVAGDDAAAFAAPGEDGGSRNGPLIPQAESARTATATATPGAATMPRMQATISRNIGLES